MSYQDQRKRENKIELTRKTILEDEDYLRQISIPVDFNDEKLSEEIEALKDYCLETECFALAAIQVGIPKRIVCIKQTTEEDSDKEITRDDLKVLINPEIISRKGNTKYWEACLSCLDLTGCVNRPYEMLISYQDEEGNYHEKTISGFEATVYSHEFDNLDGILHMDIADYVIEMTTEERKEFRQTHPYEIIDKDKEYQRPSQNKRYVR